MIIPVLLARLDSTRLPCKSLLVLPTGETIIDFILSQLDSLKGLNKLNSPILATTNREIDDPLAKFAEKRGLLVYRGSTDNVLERILQAGISQKSEYVMRVNCDSPFIDDNLVAKAITACQIDAPDVITNLMPRSYPYGITIQILKIKTFIDLIQKYKPSKDEAEHITPYIEKYQDRVKIHKIINCEQISYSKRFVVDTIDDYRTLYMDLEPYSCLEKNRSKIKWYDLINIS